MVIHQTFVGMSKQRQLHIGRKNAEMKLNVKAGLAGATGLHHQHATLEQQRKGSDFAERTGTVS